MEKHKVNKYETRSSILISKVLLRRVCSRQNCFDSALDLQPFCERED